MDSLTRIPSLPVQYRGRLLRGLPLRHPKVAKPWSTLYLRIASVAQHPQSPVIYLHEVRICHTAIAPSTILLGLIASIHCLKGPYLAIIQQKRLVILACITPILIRILLHLCLIGIRLTPFHIRTVAISNKICLTLHSLLQGTIPELRSKVNFL